MSMSVNRLSLAFLTVIVGEILALFFNIVVGSMYLPFDYRLSATFFLSGDGWRRAYGSLVFFFMTNVHEKAIIITLVCPVLNLFIKYANFLGAGAVALGQYLIAKEFIHEDFGLQHTLLCALASSPIYISLIAAGIVQYNNKANVTSHKTGIPST